MMAKNDDIDMTDTWMNPQPVTWTQPPEPEPDQVDYLIERAKKTIVFGNPGSITEWAFWARFDNKKDRDKELKRLSKDHPMWHLRARDSYPYKERLGIYPSMSHPGINR
jgi:hypothetical protein